MSLETMRAFVETRVKSVILASAFPSTTIRFDNVPFSQPKNAPYVAVHIMDGSSFQANLGNRFTERHPGVVQIDVVVPKDGGKHTQNLMAEAIGSSFRALRASLADQASVQFKTPSYKDLGEEGPWCVMAVSLPFIRDEKVSQAQL